MIKINLLGKKKTTNIPFQLDEKLARFGIKPEDFETFKPLGMKLVVLTAGIYGASFGPEYFYKIDFDKEKTAINKELRERREQRKEMEKLNKEESELKRQLDAVQSLNKERTTAFHTVLSIITDLPQKVWLTRLDYKDKKVVMEGASYDYFSINDFFKLVSDRTTNTNVIFRWMRAHPPTHVVAGVPLSVQQIKTFTLEYMVKEGGVN